ncbi:MAG: hypothetical protein KGJ79_03100 [Alphaproteobacteria bacterium]|nr:hypothetical protein [Alphaproteobacteria bacterium]MDE2110104.1 hypothetical protein [Alphaproteobacteria bacterium]MDE2495130.1 hypothetical protein [Alphaproteobacteria bacterium]
MTAALAALLSGAMFYLSQGLDNVWALAWLAPAPLLWLAYGVTPRWQVLAASFAAFVAGQAYVVQCYWGMLPPLIVAPLEIAMCSLFPLTVLFAGEVLRRVSALVALVTFPVSWASVEFIVGQFSPHGTFGSLAYAEVSFPAGIQITSLFGLYAVTFLLCLSANAVALGLREKWRAAGAGAAVCALALIFGLIRLAEPAGQRLEVAALSDADVWHAESRSGTLGSRVAAAETYAAFIKRQRGIGVFVTPEGSVQMSEDAQKPVLTPLAAASREAHALLVVGTYIPTPEQNRAFAFFPDGTAKTYAKRHLLAPFEMEAPGRGSGYLGDGFSTQICKDMDFPATVRQTARHGVRLMIVPANDFKRDGWVHARMAVMRGVENGFAVLRTASNGLETSSDAEGRLLASASTMRSGMVMAKADVPLGPGPTLYTRIGDTFGWLCVAFLFAIGAYTLFFEKRTTWAQRSEYFSARIDPNV